MPITYTEHLHRSTRRYGDRDEGWARARANEQRAREWKAYDPACQLEWKEPPCDEGFFPSSRAQSVALNAEIDEIYDQLVVLVAKRNSSPPDSGLEDQIAQLFERLEKLQKQEGDLIRTMFSSPPAGAIAIGLAILDSADELRAKYGNITSSNATPNDPHRTKT